MTSPLAARAAKKRSQTRCSPENVPRFPVTPEPVPLPRFSVVDDLRAAIGLWAAWLSGERRASPHTIAAYGRDLAAFFDFLTEHLGEVPGLAAIDALRPADFRAYLARRAGEGLERSSLARTMSVLRNFIRFLQRRGLGATTALAALRSPKLPAAVPKPLTVADAVAVVDSAAECTREGWQKKRDTAAVGIDLWLRFAAVGGARAQSRGSADRRSADGDRQGRQNPAIAGVASSARRDRRLSRRLSVRTGRGLSTFCRVPRRTAASASGAAADGGVARISRPARRPRRRTRCATASRRICSAPAAICERSRSCWDMPACRRRSATLRSIPNGCWRSMTTRIRAPAPELAHLPPAQATLLPYRRHRRSGGPGPRPSARRLSRLITS